MYSVQDLNLFYTLNDFGVDNPNSVLLRKAISIATKNADSLRRLRCILFLLNISDNDVLILQAVQFFRRLYQATVFEYPGDHIITNLLSDHLNIGFDLQKSFDLTIEIVSKQVKRKIDANTYGYAYTVDFTPPRY